jgi:Periplasmic binding protein
MGGWRTGHDEGRSVPGEGVEPSRAEAHGFLRPARLPIPPSRPGRSRVAGRETRANRSVRAGLVTLLAIALPACADATRAPSATDLPTVAFLFDGSPPDAELVTAPALAGLELAAYRTGTIEVEPVDLGLAPADVATTLDDLVADRGVVAAVIAPWTAPPNGAIDLLAAHGLPVVTLSSAWGPPAAGDGLWLSLVVDPAREAVLLLSAADVAPKGAPVCLAGDGLATSRALLATAEELARAAGDPEVRTADTGCPVLAWAGGAPGAEAVLRSRAEDLPSVVVGTSRIKTDEGLALATSAIEVLTVCACADVTLTLDPVLQRFVHDVQAESGAPPGPFTVEAYDAGSLLTSIVADVPGEDLRAGVAAAVGDAADVEGIAGDYAFEPDGSRPPRTVIVGVWRAAGSRWLPVERSTVPP